MKKLIEFSKSKYDINTKDKYLGRYIAETLKQERCKEVYNENKVDIRERSCNRSHRQIITEKSLGEYIAETLKQ